MIRKRLTRALAASGLALALVASLLAVPFVTLAATPDWHVDPVVSLPDTVKPGSNAGYQLTIYNDGTSNISQLYLFTLGSAPNPVYSVPSQGSCANTGGPLFCSIGPLRSGKSATIIVAFPTPSAATGTFSVDFEFNTTGLGSGGGDNSHGDAIDQTGTTSLSADGTNFAGGFVIGSGVQVANAAISGAGNKQSTRVFSPSSAIPVTVEDGPGAASPCPAGFSGCVLETSEIHVGDGTDKYGIFKVVIEIDKTALTGLSLNKLVVIHVPDVGAAYEITATCPKNGTPSAECATFSKLPGGSGQVTIWLKSNGVVKFH